MEGIESGQLRYSQKKGILDAMVVRGWASDAGE